MVGTRNPGYQTMDLGTTRRILLGSLILVQWSLNPADAEPVKIYKCVDASGQTTFQQGPCAEWDRQQQLTVAGDTQANIDAADEATRLREQRRLSRAQDEALRQFLESRRRATTPPPIPQRPQQPAALEPCPPTYENPGSACAVAWGEPLRPADGLCVKALPSKIYLKRNGKLPAHCE